MTIIKRIKNRYTFWDKVKLLNYLIQTKFICRKARIIRPGFVIRGKKMIDLGSNLTTGYRCRIEAFSYELDNKDFDINTKIVFKNNVQINDEVHISAIKSVKIGNDVLIASFVYISDNSHGCFKGVSSDTSPYSPPIQRPYFVEPVVIEDRVWLGEGVIVLPGVTIGSGTIVGAHSIVNKSLPPNCIAVGSPIRVIKKWDENKKQWLRIC